MKSFQKFGYSLKSFFQNWGPKVCMAKLLKIVDKMAENNAKIFFWNEGFSLNFSLYTDRRMHPNLG